MSDMNESDGDDVDEPDPIAHCDCCGEPIYEGSEQYETPDGYVACSEGCLHELEEWSEDDEEEEAEPDGNEETEETEKHFFQADGRIIKGVDNLNLL